VREKQWLACADPEKMLNFLLDKVSDRKFRLYACACCRRTWRFLKDKRSRRAIEVSERFADGEAAHEELLEAEGDAWDAARGQGSGSKYEVAAWAASDIEVAIDGVPMQAVVVWGREKKRIEEIIALCEMVRDIFGNPFRPVRLGRAWLTPTVTNLAQSAYEERALPSGELDPTRLAVLADALEEAGCDQPGLLSHLRGPGPHVRGCWALDLLLGKG
jgi:hypothetical protein